MFELLGGHRSQFGRQGKNPVAARLEPRVLGFLLLAVDAGPLVVIKDDDAAGDYTVEQHIE